MNSILVWVTFCINYCFSVAWQGCIQSVVLLRCNWSPGCFESDLRSSALLGLGSLIFLLAVSLRFSPGFISAKLSDQSTEVTPQWLNHLGALAVWTGANSCWKMKPASPYSLLEESMRFCNISQTTLTVKFRKHIRPAPADDMVPQVITACGNFTLDFK